MKNRDLAYCERVIKQHSKSFYYAFSQLPKQDRLAVYAIYAFCRMCDDAVDEEQGSIDQIQRELDHFKRGKVVDHPVWRALAWVHERYEINTDFYDEQIEGQRMDLMFKQPETFETLVTYCEKVAASVGGMLLPILSHEVDAQRYAQARRLGVAMQLTNILRDVGEDYRDLQRIYLPRQMMTHYGVTETQIAQEQVTNGFKQLFEALAAEAETRYKQFRDELSHYKREARLPVCLSATVYGEILNVIREHHYDSLSQRHVVPRSRKQALYHKEKHNVGG